MGETERRRNMQIAFNTEHNITPRGVDKSVADIMEGSRVIPGRKRKSDKSRAVADTVSDYSLSSSGGSLDSPKQILEQISLMERDMHEHAKNLEFEQAAFVRDQIGQLRERLIKLA